MADGRHFEKSKNRYISAMDLAILMTIWHGDASRSSGLNLTTVASKRRPQIEMER